MSRFRRILLLGALGLAACHAPAVAPKPTPKGSKAATVVQATPTASATPAPSPTPLAALQPPANAYVSLTGTIKVDAHYLLSNNAGNLVGSDRVAVGDARLLSNNAGNLVAGRQGGSVQANADGSFLAANNAGIIANNGGSIISDHGGAIVANNGGGLLTDAGAGRRLLALPYRGPAAVAAVNALGTGEIVPATGTLLPAGGLVVSAVSLRDQQYVPVGADAAGQPVYAIYSDAAGGYKLYLPATAQGNVAVVASVPGTQDARLVYNAIAPLEADASAQVDDDAAVTTRMIRRALAGQIALIITAADNATNIHAITEDGTVPLAFQQPLVRVVTALHQRAKDLGVPEGDTARDVPAVQVLSRALADVVLGYIPYDDVKLDPLLVPAWHGPQDKLFTAVNLIFGHLREATRAYMQAKDAKEVVVPIAVQAPGGGAECTYEDRIPLHTPADPGLYVVDDLLARNQSNTFFNTAQVFRALATSPGVDPNVFYDANHQPFEESERLRACSSVLFAYFALTLAPPDSTAEAPAPAFATMLKTLEAHAAAHPLKGDPSPRPRIGQGTPCIPKATAYEQQ